MAKFFKSLFNSGEKKKTSVTEEEDRNDFTPPLDSRRKLSISRSGRMKQNKKRASITQDLFGEEYRMQEKRVSKEYHVHGKTFTENSQLDSAGQAAPAHDTAGHRDNSARAKNNEQLLDAEKEIEVAFQIIDINTDVAGNED